MDLAMNLDANIRCITTDANIIKTETTKNEISPDERTQHQQELQK